MTACTAPRLASPPGPGPGLVLGPSAEGWDSAQLAGPRVLREADGSWRMWYSGREGTFPAVTDWPTGRIGLATSRDGFNWQRVQGPGTLGSLLDPTVDPDRFDTGHLAAGGVSREGDRYVLWYFGGRPGEYRTGSLRLAGFPASAVRAVSLDGIAWQRDWGPDAGAQLAPGPAGSTDASMVAWPQAVSVAANRVHLYYSALDDRGISRVHLALSGDGRRFARVGPVLEPGPAGSFDARGAGEAQVTRVPDGWWMFYAGTDEQGRKAIGFARSADGRIWEKVPGPLPGGAVLAPPADPDAWDAGGVGTPWLVAGDGERLHLYYTGVSRSTGFGPWRRLPRHAIGVAVSAGDPTRWERPGP
jgi:hypothetical protein